MVKVKREGKKDLKISVLNAPKKMKFGQQGVNEPSDERSIFAGSRSQISSRLSWRLFT